MNDCADWGLIESDPQVFTEILHQYGVENLQCGEVFDIDELGKSVSTAFALIWCFPYEKGQASAEVAQSNENLEHLIFFKQVVQNACASVALINILCNLNESDVEIGGMIRDFKKSVEDFSPEVRGTVLSLDVNFRKIHNELSSPSYFDFGFRGKKSTNIAYHYVAFMPFGNHLVELDGLQEQAVSHGTLSNDENWLSRMRTVLRDRVSSDGNYNLLSVEFNRRYHYNKERQAAVENSEMDSDLRSRLLTELDVKHEYLCAEEAEAHIQILRRKHNYAPLVMELLKILAEEQLLLSRSRLVADLSNDKAGKEKISFNS